MLFDWLKVKLKIKQFLAINRNWTYEYKWQSRYWCGTLDLVFVLFFSLKISKLWNLICRDLTCKSSVAVQFYFLFRTERIQQFIWVSNNKYISFLSYLYFSLYEFLLLFSNNIYAINKKNLCCGFCAEKNFHKIIEFLVYISLSMCCGRCSLL